MSVGMLFAVAFVPGFLPASLHVIYIAVRCGISPELGPALPKEERTHSFTQIAYMALQTSPIINGLSLYPAERLRSLVAEDVVQQLVGRGHSWKHLRQSGFESRRAGGRLDLNHSATASLGYYPVDKAAVFGSCE